MCVCVAVEQTEPQTASSSSSSSSQTELTAAAGSTLRSFSPGFDMLRLGGRMCALSALLSVLLAGVVASSSSSSDLFDNQLGDINYCKKQCQLVIKNKSPAKVSDVTAVLLRCLPPSAGCLPTILSFIFLQQRTKSQHLLVSEQKPPCLDGCESAQAENGCSALSSAF